MATNGHTTNVAKQDSKGAAILEVNSLREDDQHVNPADHYGKNNSIHRLFVFVKLF